ncbi:ADP-ribosylation factor-like protein 6-interacting protein 4 [Daphnia pulicaria]|uniref:ADP-ribosylation factor-like protein 6-interacting protein 4 n=1 Tax=Daphnia pulicaria TaxID=35523 RepID=UPI001EEA0D17|nr:ADP-ribosylation factor-like protein 6-interacting protein 4 [Daphnia pulicaria]XP_046656915.1 ADP-ribosylation factor-like protein 6-interacting protein 4 [Daphnia pulicaria]
MDQIIAKGARSVSKKSALESKQKRKKEKKSKKSLKEKISRKKHLKKKSRKRHSSSSSSDSSSSSSSGSSSSESSEDEKAKKRKKKNKKSKAKKKKAKLEASIVKAVITEIPLTLPVSVSQTKPTLETNVGPHIDLNSSKIRAPMTKEEYEKQQNTLKWIVDPETGRRRLIRGSGEIMEEIVSRERHQAINKQATIADGNFFQAQANLQARSSYD